jgi:hypothetical protein
MPQGLPGKRTDDVIPDPGLQVKSSLRIGRGGLPKNDFGSRDLQEGLSEVSRVGNGSVAHRNCRMWRFR